MLRDIYTINNLTAELEVSQDLRFLERFRDLYEALEQSFQSRNIDLAFDIIDKLFPEPPKEISLGEFGLFLLLDLLDYRLSRVVEAAKLNAPLDQLSDLRLFQQSEDRAESRQNRLMAFTSISTDAQHKLICDKYQELLHLGYFQEVFGIDTNDLEVKIRNEL